MPSINMIAPRRAEKKRLERDMRRLVVVIAAMLNSMYDHEDQPKPATYTLQTGIPAVATTAALAPSQAVLARINSLTDCAELQRQFDTAMDNHELQHQLGNLDMMRITTAYAEAADARMRQVGCY